MALRKRTNAYWDKRALERLDLSEKTSEAYRKRIASVYDKAQKATLADLKKIYATYWTKEGGFDKQKLSLITASGNMKKFVEDLKKAGLYDQIPKNYLGRISRLEYLNAQMWYQAHMAGQAQDKLLTVSNRKVYNDSYYHSAFDASKGLGVTPAFATLDRKTVDRILETKFSGKNYSKRIWTNSDVLANQLQDKLAVAIANGQSIYKTARDIRERFNVSRYNAERLIRTETNYFHNSGEIDSYKSMGFKHFQFLATLDNRTSEMCAEMDGKVFDVDKGAVGYNIPPLHVNCRSTIVPYFKDFEPEETRIYRNPNTGRNEYADKMDYKKWKTRYVESDLYSSGLRYNKYIPEQGDQALISKSIKQAERILEDYPKLKAKLNKERGLEIQVADLSSRGAKGATILKKDKVLLDSRTYSDKKRYRDILAKEIEANAKMRVPKKYYDLYTITHEMGHVIEEQVMRINKSATYRSIRNDIIKMAEDISGQNKSNLLPHMSIYGKTKPQEFFAEAFTSYRLGGNNIWAKAMSKYMKKWKKK